MPKDKQKHKTIGVSFNPLLRQRALLRARKLGLCFSRYVSACVEAELALSLAQVQAPYMSGASVAGGQGAGASANRKARSEAAVQTVAGGFAVVRGRRAVRQQSEAVKRDGFSAGVNTERNWRGDTACAYAAIADGGIENTATGDVSAVAATGVDTLVAGAAGRRIADTGDYFFAGGSHPLRLQGDIAALLGCSKFDFSRDVLIGSVYADFVVAECLHAGGVVARLAVLCYCLDDASQAVLLGNALMLAQSQDVAAIVLCVPYVSGVEPHIAAIFCQHGIRIVSPDTLLAAAEDLLKYAC